MRLATLSARTGESVISRAIGDVITKRSLSNGGTRYNKLLSLYFTNPEQPVCADR